MEMTRDELIEVMARAICAGQGMYWEDQFGIYSSNGDPSVHEAFKHDAAAAPPDVEAAGVGLVLQGEAPAQLIDGDERTTVRIFTPYAPLGG